MHTQEAGLCLLEPQVVADAYAQPALLCVDHCERLARRQGVRLSEDLLARKVVDCPAPRQSPPKPAEQLSHEPSKPISSKGGGLQLQAGHPSGSSLEQCRCVCRRDSPCSGQCTGAPCVGKMACP